jgi:hypothetical protein
MFLGWITGMHPPGKTLACFTAGKVVMHKLQVRQQEQFAGDVGTFCLVWIIVPSVLLHSL